MPTKEEQELREELKIILVPQNETIGYREHLLMNDCFELEHCTQIKNLVDFILKRRTTDLEKIRGKKFPAHTDMDNWAIGYNAAIDAIIRELEGEK